MTRGPARSSIRDFIGRQPFAAAILAMLAVAAMALPLPAALGSIAGFSIAGAHGPTVVVWLLLTAVIIAFLHRLGLLATAGFQSPAHWRNARLLWVPFLYAGVPLLNLPAREFVEPLDASRMGSALAEGMTRGLTVALLEETTFRGLLPAILLGGHAARRNVTAAILFSALLFGVWHLPSALAAPHWSLSVAQLIYPVFMGVGASAVLLRTRSIWPLIAAHALLIAMNVLVRSVTLAESAPTSGEMIRTALLSTAVMVPYLFYGLYLLRGYERSA